MKKIILSFSILLFILVAKAQNTVSQTKWQQLQSYSTLSEENTLAPYMMFQQMGNNTFQRKATRYRILGASAGELGTLTDTLTVKFSGNRESRGLINGYYYVYQLGTPYSSDPYDNITEYSKFGNSYKVNKWSQKKYDANERLIESADSLFGQINKSTYTYTTSGDVELALAEVYYGSGWQNYSKSEYTYTSDSLTRKSYSWSSGAWKLTGTETTYGDRFYPDSVINNQNKKTYTYDTAYNILTYGEYVYSSQTGTYEPTKRENWTYTGGLVTDIEGESWMQGVWEKTGKNRITYTSAGEIDSVIGSIWKNSAYENYSLNVSTYQGTKLKDFTNYSWANGTWSATNKFAFILDAQLKLNQVHFYINQGGVLKFVRRYRYYYESYNSTLGIDNINTENTINVYPNPASATLNFELQNTDAQVVKIYDLTGKLLFEKAIDANTPSVALSTNSFTNGNGIFIYTITSKEKTQTGKFIVNQ